MTTKLICGIDEAGRGPVLGPLVVVGVKLSTTELPKLQRLNVRDSKLLSKTEREKLALELKNLVEYKIELLSADELDKQRASKNLNLIEFELFVKLIKALEPVDVVYVDAVDPNPSRLAYKLQALVGCPRVKIIAEHQADVKYPIVSAASIIAKTIRDAELERICKTLGVDSIGSGYPHDPHTINFIKNWLKTHGTLPPHIRHSWDTTKRLLATTKYKPRKLFN